MIPAAFSFGCPRSGTTFMQRALADMGSVFTEKIGEGSMFHPCKSTRGLLDLAHLLASRRVVFVRTVRHPVEIAASFVATRVFVEDDQDSFEGLAKNTDRDIVNFVRSESISFAAQKNRLASRGWPHKVVEVRYERLDEKSYREDTARDICEALECPDELDALEHGFHRFGKQSVRPGRMSRGEDPITKKKRGSFSHQLSETIRREGYA